MREKYDFLDILNRYFNVNMILGVCSVVVLLNVQALTTIAGLVSLVCAILSLIYTWRLYKTSNNKKMRTVFWLHIATGIIVFIMFISIMSMVMNMVFNQYSMTGYGSNSAAYVENIIEANAGLLLMIIAFAVALLVIRIITTIFTLSFFKEEIPTEKIVSIYPTILTVSIIAIVLDIVISAFMNSQAAVNVSSILSTAVFLYFLNLCRKEYELLLNQENEIRYQDFE
ncbi:MAG: hypothetical protein RR565_06975 [Erysipelothrix sp.]